MASEFPKLLNTREAGPRVGLSPRALEGMRVRGGGPLYVKLGSGPRARVMYREGDLLAWIEGGARRSTSDPGVAA
jgi:hypothetical protein